jgi:hypothetical protein
MNASALRMSSIRMSRVSEAFDLDAHSPASVLPPIESVYLQEECYFTIELVPICHLHGSPGNITSMFVPQPSSNGRLGVSAVYFGALPEFDMPNAKLTLGQVGLHRTSDSDGMVHCDDSERPICELCKDPRSKSQPGD